MDHAPTERPTLDDILERLEPLEREARRLEPDPNARARLVERAHEYAEAFLERIDDGPAFIEEDSKGIGLLDHPIREQGTSIDEILEILAREVDRPSLNPASGGHLGYIPGGGIYPSAVADFIADVTNRYSGVFFASPGAVRMENMLVRWMAGLVGYPDSAHGDLTSGGSIANLTAIVTAREARGVVAAEVPRSAIYMTAQAHHCVGKALRIAGLGEAPVRTVPMDDRFRMDPGALEAAIVEDRSRGLRPFLVVASAGTTDTGAVDPVDVIADVAGRHGLWLHVDGAYGGFFLLCAEGRAVLHGLERTDSIVLDPHKGLFLPYGSGAVLLRDREALFRAHVYRASYMQDTLRAQEEPSPADHSPELTRHFRGLRLWLPLQLFGLEPFRAALSEKLWLTRYFYDRVQEIRGIEVGPYPELSVAIFRYVPERGEANEANAWLTRAVQEDGRVFLSSTMIDGTFWLRMAILAFRTHRRTVDQALDVIREKVGELAGGPASSTAPGDSSSPGEGG